MVVQEHRVAIVGATGYVGGRLGRRLLGHGIATRVLGRQRQRLLPFAALGAEVAVADVADPAATRAALQGVTCAYYLVHSMASKGDFAARDRHCATVFRDAAAETGVARIIYLGGLGEQQDHLSAHLASRREVAQILQAGPVPVTVLRAGVIVGGGSASFRMIRDLVTHLPLMICPRWVRTLCQPIAVDDALGYLAACLHEPRTRGEQLDMGGPDVLSYQAMMETYARLARRPQVILPVPVLTPRLSSYWIGLVTAVPASIAQPLIEGVRSPAVCEDHRIQDLLPGPLQSYEEAIRRILRSTGNA